MKRYAMMIVFLGVQIFAATNVRIVEVQGQIQVRHGLEETWKPAGPGMLLDDLDTILSGEASRVVLQLKEELHFTLGGNAMLDVSDLRRITERELFLILMSKKVSRIQSAGSTEPIRIANVSVVRGTDQSMKAPEATDHESRSWVREKNGAASLYQAQYYTNTVVKLVNVLERHPDCEDGGEIHWMLGRSFEALNQPGRAIEAYRTALDRYHASDPEQQDKTRRASIELGLERLKSEGADPF